MNVSSDDCEVSVVGRLFHIVQPRLEKRGHQECGDQQFTSNVCPCRFSLIVARHKSKI